MAGGRRELDKQEERGGDRKEGKERKKRKQRIEESGEGREEETKIRRHKIKPSIFMVSSSLHDFCVK